MLIDAIFNSRLHHISDVPIDFPTVSFAEDVASA
jgi:hypothetical protein